MQRPLANTYIKPSAIHGLGLFALVDIKKGTEIMQGVANYGFIDEWIAYNRSGQLPSFEFNNGYCMLNHSKNPNTKRKGSALVIVASCNIKQGAEVTEDYELLPYDHNPFNNHIDFEKYAYYNKYKKQLTYANRS